MHAETQVDRLELASAAMIEAVRVQPSVYAASEVAGTRLALRAFVPPLPVFPVLLDLPLLTGDERPQAPYVAVTARPWQGPVAVWDAAADDGYQLNTLLSSPATLGMTLTELEAAPTGLWDNGAPVRVKLSNGSFASASELAVLNGANLVAIGDGASQQWEVFQFRQANLVGPETYELSLRLRGQFGTDANAPQVWPAGSLVILLDRSLVQLDLASSNLGLARHYRIGVASRGTDDRNVTHRVEAFAGTGLRPYSPVHLRTRLLGNGDIHLSWIRRTRVDGDSWALADVPLGESNEQYLVRIGLNGQTLREVVVPAPTWTYTASLQASDGAGGTTFVEVAQLSERFGPGPFARRPLFAV